MPKEKGTRNLFDPYLLFKLAWPLGLLTHITERPELWAGSISHLVLMISCIVCLFFPRSSLLFLFTISIQLYCWFAHMPYVANHWLFAAVVNMILLAAFFIDLAKHRWKVDANGTRFIETAVPSIKFGVVLLYLISFFHKLNWGYLSVETSCAVPLFGGSLGNFHVPEFSVSKPFEYLAIYGSLISELLIGMFLAFRRTWVWGLLIGVVFHLATIPILVSFAAIMLPLYLLFLPRLQSIQTWVDVDKVVRKLSWERLNILRMFKVYAFLFTGFSLLEYLNKNPFPMVDETIIHRVMLYTWGVLGMIALGVIVASFWRYRLFKVIPHQEYRLGSWALFVFPALLVFSSLSPYLGLKTVPALSMFSNLVTEDGQSNHLVVPALRSKLFGFQEDIVEILASSEDAFYEMSFNGQMITYVMFKRKLQTMVKEGVKNIYIQFRRGSIVFNVNKAENDEELMSPEPFWSKKLLNFRLVDPNLVVKCPW